MREIECTRAREKEGGVGLREESKRNSPIKVFLFIVNLTCCMYVCFTIIGTINRSKKTFLLPNNDLRILNASAVYWGEVRAVDFSPDVSYNPGTYIIFNN